MFHRVEIAYGEVHDLLIDLILSSHRTLPLLLLLVVYKDSFGEDTHSEVFRCGWITIERCTYHN